MDLKPYFPISSSFWQIFKKDYKHSILYKSRGLFLWALKYLRNMDNKSSMDLLVYFLQLLMDISERMDNKSSMDIQVYFLLFSQAFGWISTKEYRQ